MEFERGGILFTEWKEGEGMGEGEIVVEFAGEDDVELYRECGYVRGSYGFKLKSGKWRRVSLRVGVVKGECKVEVKLNPALVKIGVSQISKEQAECREGNIQIGLYCGKVKKDVNFHGLKSKKDREEYALGRIWEIEGEVEVEKDFPLAQVEFKRVKKVYYRVSSIRS